MIAAQISSLSALISTHQVISYTNYNNLPLIKLGLLVPSKSSDGLILVKIQASDNKYLFTKEHCSDSLVFLQSISLQNFFMLSIGL